MLCEWRVRKKGSSSNPYHDYSEFPTVFCLKINHGGEFTSLPKRRYKGGKVNWIDTIDSDHFSVQEVGNMMKELGYEPEGMEFFFKLPNCDLDNGLRKLEKDDDVLQLLKNVGKYKVIDLYVLHCVKSKDPKFVENVSDNSDEVLETLETDVSEDEWLSNCTKKVKRLNRNVDDSESEYSSDSEHGSYSDSDDSDFIVDEEQLVNDVEVDMAEFRSNIDTNVDYTKQYAMLRDYLGELQKQNPDTTVRIDLERPNDPIRVIERKFRRVYICLGALKEGFKKGKRDLLGLDGCFLSGPFPGQVLTAVGVDPNNGIYPLAYAIVEAETKDSWKWFLDWLGDDLNLFSNSNFTFITDRQKGVIPALAELYPSAEHRYCVKHIYDNMKLSWRGEMYKNLFWKCAKSTTIQMFDINMEALKAHNKEAFEWLKKIPPQHWSKSHFSGRAKCDVLLNNMCEVLNRQLVEGRDKPIITCLEFIREYLMKRIVNVQKVISKTDGPLTPYAARLLKVIVKEASQLKVEWNGGELYQVNGPWGDQCMVSIKDRNCTCRRWDLSGIPCKHSVASIWNMATNGIETSIPESYCHPSHWLSTWEDMYRCKINPTRSPNYWEKCNVVNTIIPPDYKPQIGRPRKKRRKSAAELADKMVQGSKLSRSGKSVTCKLCKQVGHNQRSCKAQRDGGTASASGASKKGKGGSTKSGGSMASQNDVAGTQGSSAPSMLTPLPLLQTSPSKWTKSAARRLG